jgi:hypothetical protein
MFSINIDIKEVYGAGADGLMESCFWLPDVLLYVRWSCSYSLFYTGKVLHNDAVSWFLIRHSFHSFYSCGFVTNCAIDNWLIKLLIQPCCSLLSDVDGFFVVVVGEHQFSIEFVCSL